MADGMDEEPADVARMGEWIVSKAREARDAIARRGEG